MVYAVVEESGRSLYEIMLAGGLGILMDMAYRLEDPQVPQQQGEHLGRLWTTHYSHATRDCLVYQRPLCSAIRKPSFSETIVTVQAGSKPSTGSTRAKSATRRVAQGPLAILLE